MIDTSILKALLQRDFWAVCEGRLSKTLFGEELRDLYECVEYGHEKYDHDLTPDELLLLWKQRNPVATQAEKIDVTDLVNTIKETEPTHADLAKDVIEHLWRREIGKQIATLGLAMSEGDAAAMARLQTMLEQHADGFMPDDFGDPTSQDITELLRDTGDESRFRFNIETLARHVYGIGREEFGVVFATPETGKTAFMVSIACGPEGFVDQGARVLILGNEESTRRTVVRAFSAATGMTRAQMAEDIDRARMVYKARTQNRLIFKDIQDWDMDKVSAYCNKMKPDVLLIDQADKVSVRGNFNAGHERLRAVYNQLRELAKRHKCAVIGVSQASAEAATRTKLDYTMMEGSKIGKAAEADLIIGIGKHANTEGQEPDNARFLTVSKNKLSGWHGTIIVNIQPEISRYVE